VTAAEQKQMLVTEWQIDFCSRCSSKAKQSSNERRIAGEAALDANEEEEDEEEASVRKRQNL
jgi:hypothetical protein